MTNFQITPTPFFELLITKFATKSLTIRLYEENSTNPPRVKYEITSHSTGKTREGIQNNEGKAFAAAIEQAGYDPKEKALSEIKNHNHVKDNFYKIGTLEFNKVIRKALS